MNDRSPDPSASPMTGASALTKTASARAITEPGPPHGEIHDAAINSGAVESSDRLVRPTERSGQICPG